jgi:hypothetical protein
MPTTAPAQAINKAAVVDAALRAIYTVLDGETDIVTALAASIKENQESREELVGLIQCMSIMGCEDTEEEDALNAFGLGMVAGILYAANAGTTLPVPLLKEIRAANPSMARVKRARVNTFKG